MDILAQLHNVINTPLAVTEDYADLLAAWVEKSFSTQKLQEFSQAKPLSSSQLAIAGGQSADVNIAVIPIHSSLAHRATWFDVGYDEIKMNVREAISNPEVDGILFDIDSPGGEVSGLHDCCKWIRSVSENKPIWTIANEHSYSAAYSIASATNKIIMPESAGVGSIGVVLAHVDVSKAMEEAGVKITLIAKGKFKTFGNAYEPLSDEARSVFEKSLEAPYERFTGSVAQYRDIDQEVVKNTEAGIFDSKTALQLGLVDEIMSADDAIGSFAEFLRSTKTTSSFGDIGLDTDKNTDELQAKVDAAEQTGYERGLKEGAANESTRIFGILDAPESQGKEATAKKWILKGKSKDEVLEILEDVPAAKQSTKPSDDDELSKNMKGKDARAANSIQGDAEEPEEDENLADFGKRKSKAAASVTDLLKDKGGVK